MIYLTISISIFNHSPLIAQLSEIQTIKLDIKLYIESFKSLVLLNW